MAQKRTLWETRRVSAGRVIASGLLAVLITGAQVITQPTSPSGQLHNAVHPRFDLTMPSGGPFPSDRFTVNDPDQNTGRRVALPMPDDCVAKLSDCEDIADLNQLDGFHLHPRLSIPFDGEIDPATATGDNIFVIALGDASASSNRADGAPLPGGSLGRTVGINRVVWDPDSDTLYANADDPLEEHTLYALIVTRGVHDAGGFPIEPSVEFERYRRDMVASDEGTMRGTVARCSLRNGRRTGEACNHGRLPQSACSRPRARRICSRRSAIRSSRRCRRLRTSTLGPMAVARSTPSADITSIVFNQQLTTGPTLTPFVGPNLLPLRFVPGAVGRIAFGRFEAADYMVHPGEYIPAIATRSGTPAVQGFNTLYFNVILPSGPNAAERLAGRDRRPRAGRSTRISWSTQGRRLSRRAGLPRFKSMRWDTGSDRSGP